MGEGSTVGRECNVVAAGGRARIGTAATATCYSATATPGTHNQQGGDSKCWQNAPAAPPQASSEEDAGECHAETCRPDATCA